MLRFLCVPFPISSIWGLVPEDQKKALELIYAGANKGDKQALEKLAEIFQNGELGEPQDSIKAVSVRAVVPTCGI